MSRLLFDPEVAFSHAFSGSRSARTLAHVVEQEDLAALFLN